MSHTLGLGQIEKELDLAGPRAVIAQVQEEVNKSSCQKFVKMGTFSESPLEEKAIILQNDFISKYSSLSSGKAFTFYGLQSLKAYRVLVCFQMGEYSFSSPFPIQYAETDFITYSEKDFFFLLWVTGKFRGPITSPVFQQYNQNRSTDGLPIAGERELNHILFTAHF